MLEMKLLSNIIVIEVDDRKDSPEDSFVLARFQNVTVSVGTDSSINTAEGKFSCGKQSYHGKGYKTYKWDFYQNFLFVKKKINTFRYICPVGTKGQYIFIQMWGKNFLQISHVRVLARASIESFMVM